MLFNNKEKKCFVFAFEMTHYNCLVSKIRTQNEKMIGQILTFLHKHDRDENIVDLSKSVGRILDPIELDIFPFAQDGIG